MRSARSGMSSSQSVCGTETCLCRMQRSLESAEADGLAQLPQQLLARYAYRMRAFVRLCCPDGSVAELTHGDLIGRLGTAALHLDDARISEAHAMISLRGGELKMLALRGRFALGSKPVTSLTLAAGQRIRFAPDIALRVEEVVLPEEVLAVVIGDAPHHILTGVCAICLEEGRLRLVPGYREGAAALLWNRDDRWRIRIGAAPPAVLKPGDRHTIAGLPLAAIGVSLSRVGEQATRMKGGLSSPIRLVVQYDAAQIHREGEPVLVLSGISARLLSELAAFGGPVDWPVLAGEVWPHVHDRHRLRRQLDVSMNRLRKKLERGRVRSDLVRSDGTGKLALVLADGDVLVDEN